MHEEEEIETLIIKSLSGTLNENEKEQIDGWISSSERNELYYQELKNIWEVSNPPFNPDFINVIEAEKKVMSQIQKTKLIDSSVFIWWQRIAAIFILPITILTGYLLYNQFFKISHNHIAYQEVVSPLGVSSKIELPDGSTVWLNSGSKLKYPIVFNSQLREVYLSGEGYFKVKSDKNHPFIVKTKNLDVTATGTQFDVEAYSKDTIAAVTLLLGKVDVNMFNGSNEKLKPNQRIVFNIRTKSYNVIETEGKQWGSWKDGILMFRDQPLGDVFKVLERVYNVDIEIKDREIGVQLYRATFNGETLEEILGLLEMSAPIKFKITNKNNSDNTINSKKRIEVYSSVNLNKK